MTDLSTFTPDDLRRATALFAHHVAGGDLGREAIWSEADEKADSRPGLAAAVVATAFDICPGLRRQVPAVAQNAPVDFHRAEAVLKCYAAGDQAGLRAVWREVAQTNSWRAVTSALIETVLDAVPRLRSAEGLAALRELARSYAALDAADGGDDG